MVVASLTSSVHPGLDGRIFISYRRDDQSALAYRLHEALSNHFRAGTVFIDIDSIELGLDFRREVERVLRHCRIVIVIIGRHWLAATDAEGNRRLDAPDDIVRMEVEEAHRDLPDWRSGEDLLRAKAFYRSVSGKAKVFLDLLIAHPGRQLSVDEIVMRTDGIFTGSRSVAGAIAGLYPSHKTSGRRYPFFWWEGRPSRYAMKASVADLFEQARVNLLASRFDGASSESPPAVYNDAVVIGEVVLTQGNINNQHISLGSVLDRFPADVKGGRSAASAA